MPSKKLELDAEGILYRNPSPGYRVDCAFQPNIVALSETELLCFYRIGQAFYSIDGRLAVLRSTDGGESWQEEGLVHDPSGDSRPFSYSGPHGTRLSDGTLLLVASRYDRSDPAAPLYNPETGGMTRPENLLFRSGDGGRTWAGPEVLSLPVEGVVDLPSQIIELKDGSLFLACEVWKSWDDPAPLHISGYAVFSRDSGRSWGGRIELPGNIDPDRMYSHGRFARMLDGRIMVLHWTQDIGASKNFDIHFIMSDTGGKNWSPPSPTGIMGQTSWAADLGDGPLAAVYTSREGMAPGVRVVLSEDGGKSWDRKSEVLVWDAVGQEFLGVSQKPSYPSSHDNIAFGKPNLTRLPDGSLICSWWCTQACVTHIRFARLHVK